MKCDDELMSRPRDLGDSCLRGGTSETLHAKCGDDDYYLQVLYDSDTALLGIWMSRIPRRILLEAVSYVFRTHGEVRRISYRYSLEPLGVWSRVNHFRIVLPESQDKLLAEMPKHERQNLNSRLRKLHKEGNITFHEYQANWNNPDTLEAFNKYFEFKNITHNRKYNLTASQYIQKYQVSNIYVLRCNDDVVAVRLSCEQCPVAGGENISYSRDYAKFYPGIIIQYNFLAELVRKGKTELFLGGSHYTGQQKYKQHFNSIEETAYEGIIYRSLAAHLVHKTIMAAKTFIKAALPVKLLAVIKSIKNGTPIEHNM